MHQDGTYPGVICAFIAAAGYALWRRGAIRQGCARRPVNFALDVLEDDDQPGNGPTSDAPSGNRS